MKSVENRVAAISGAGSGIGRELAIHLSGLGAKLALSDKNEDGLNETVALLKRSTADVLSSVVDVSDREQVFGNPAQAV